MFVDLETGVKIERFQEFLEQGAFFPFDKVRAAEKKNFFFLVWGIIQPASTLPALGNDIVVIKYSVEVATSRNLTLQINHKLEKTIAISE